MLRDESPVDIYQPANSASTDMFIYISTPMIVSSMMILADFMTYERDSRLIRMVLAFNCRLVEIRTFAAPNDKKRVTLARDLACPYLGVEASRYK